MVRTLRAALLSMLLCALFGACSPRAIRVQPGEVPSQTELSAEDEQYGQEVFSGLADKYQIDRDDARINRVRDIVERLTKAAHSDSTPWHVYVLVDDHFKNAAATRGNFIFVWTGMLKTVKSDAELATVLAHEIGHVLAGHTAADPSEETARIIAGVAGQIGGGVVSARGLGPVADLAELLIRSSLEAMLVNPDQQRKELEADEIGLFMMADAGYDPQEAVDFWERVAHDPDFGSSALEFMSSHPSSEERAKRLHQYLPDAVVRYQHPGSRDPKLDVAIRSARDRERYKKVEQGAPADDSRGDTFRMNGGKPPSNGKKKSRGVDPAPQRPDAQTLVRVPRGPENWRVVEGGAKLFDAPSDSAKMLRELPVGSEVTVSGHSGKWLIINSPDPGYALGRRFSPNN